MRDPAIHARVCEEVRGWLEGKGWRVGTAQEFLALSDEETAYIEMKLALGETLRQRREREGATQSALASRLKSSQSRVAKMEAGDPSVTLDLLIRSLLMLGMSRKDLGQVVATERYSEAPN